ncbi:MAG: glycosyltransferase [Patescibacteria group bacterium]
MINKKEYPRLALVHDHPQGWPGGGPLLLRRIFQGYPSDRLIYISSFPSRNAINSSWLTGYYSVGRQTNFGRYGLGRLKLIWSCLPWSGRTRKIKIIFKENQIESVHAVAHEFLWLPALWAAKSLNIPYVLAIHDHWPSTVRKQVPKKLANKIFCFFAKRADVIVGAHEGMSELLQKEYGLNQVGVERDGLNQEEVAARPCGFRKKRPVRRVRVGYSGMFVTYQPEFAQLHQAFSMLRERDGINATLVLCVEIGLENLQVQGWKQEELEYHSWTDYQSVQQILRSCDIFFLPMSYDPAKIDTMRWGMSCKTAQYLQAGKPILTYAPSYASIAGLARDYQIGVLVAEPDPECLYRGLRRLTEDPQLLLEIEEGSRRCIEDRFNMDRIKASIWTLLKKTTLSI